MSVKIKKEIILVYDYISANSVLPNGLNFRYLEKYIEHSFDMGKLTFDELENIYDHDPISVWNGDNIILDIFDDTVSISNVSDKKTNTIYLYTICPFGGARTTFGEKHTLNKGFTFFDFISTMALTRIKEMKNFFLFINYTNEGVIDTNWFNIIYTELTKLGIPPNKVIFGISDFNIEKNFNDWYINNKDKEKINLLYFNWSRPAKAKEYLAILKNKKEKSNPHANNRSIVTKDKINNDVKRQYKFLNFNRRIRNHRLFSILYFYHKNIIDDILISYDLTDKKCIDIENDSLIKSILNNDYSYFKDMKPILNNILNNAPKKTIDYENIGNVSGLNFENNKPYLESYIHIISETNLFEIGGYLSEKTWKPIGNLQPFIIIGAHNSLKELKKLGFKTFHPFINENYDKIENNELRLISALNEICRISMLSNEEIHKWYFSIIDILEHNQRLLLNSESLNSCNKELISKINKIYENNTISK